MSVTIIQAHPRFRLILLLVVFQYDTDIEVEYFRHGGIIHYVLRDFLSQSPVTA